MGTDCMAGMTTDSSRNSEFIYLLNAFEQASQAEDPSVLEYARKRKALLDYVAKLESAPIASETKCSEGYPGIAHDLETLRTAATAIRDNFTYDPGHSDLDNEQPIHISTTLGAWRKLNYAIGNVDIERRATVPTPRERGPV